MRHRRFAKPLGKAATCARPQREHVRDLGLLLHPERDQSPACHDHLALAVAGIDTYNWDLVSRRDVIAAGKVRPGQPVGPEEAAIGVTSD
jgi:hypothetical protein